MVWYVHHLCVWGSELKPIDNELQCKKSTVDCRDYFVYAPSQWETALQCNAVSHWLGAYIDWSLWAVLIQQLSFFPCHYTPASTHWCESLHAIDSSATETTTFIMVILKNNIYLFRYAALNYSFPEEWWMLPSNQVLSQEWRWDRVFSICYQSLTPLPGNKPSPDPLFTRFAAPKCSHNGTLN